MNVLERIRSAASRDCSLSRSLLASIEGYPSSILDILIYHRVHFHMEPDLAVKSFRQFGTEFVDWNEVRISPIREIQEHVSQGENSLELSVYIKDVLESVHRAHQRLDLEYLAEENLTEIRRRMKQFREMETATVDVVLLLRKEHPVLPIPPGGDKLLLELGLIREDDSRDRRQKTLFELIGQESALLFHHVLLDHCRRGVALAKNPYPAVRRLLADLGREHGRKSTRRTKKKAGKKRRAKSAGSSRKARAGKKSKKGKSKSRTPRR